MGSDSFDPVRGWIHGVPRVECPGSLGGTANPVNEGPADVSTPFIQRSIESDPFGFLEAVFEVCQAIDRADTVDGES